MNFNFCPKCGQQSIIAHDDKTKYECTSCGHTTWNNPKATVVVVFYEDGKILYSKRAIEPLKGKYDLPGGFLEYNEDARDGAVREVYEETTVTIEPKNLELIEVYTVEYLPNEVSTVDLIFIAHDWEGEFIPSDDSEGLEWKPLSFLESPDFVGGYPELGKKIIKAF